MATRLALAAASLLLATATYAQDPQVSGVITISGSGYTGSFEGLDGPRWWEGNRDGVYGDIRGKVGVVVAPEFSVQIDGWISQAAGGYEGETNFGSFAASAAGTIAGAATHLTYHAGDFLIGVAGSAALYRYAEQEDDTIIYGPLETVHAAAAIEGGYEGDDFRVIGQLGLTWPTGDAFDPESTRYFAALAGTYYFNPNLALTARASLSDFVEQPVASDVHATAGIELRYKLEDQPLILSAGLTGAFRELSAPTLDYNFTQAEYRAKIGISIPFGAGSETLRSLDRATGLEFNTDDYGWY